MDQSFRLPATCRGVVAIPACDEEHRIGACLAALAVQRDETGAPLDEDCFAVLVFANNCRDGTADVARRWGALCPFRLAVVEAVLPPDQSNAGWARKRAMDHAADLMEAEGLRHAVLLTTDADSRVGSTWVDRTLEEIANGADAVAGYIEAEPVELIALGRPFTLRARLEDQYLACMAEILSLCDPLPHDPWPRHRVASGASLAVTFAAYRAIGGLPPRPLGEDIALAEALVEAGFRLRHATDIVVTTSCRLDGRAVGGAADTMKLRRDEPDAPCDDDMEPLAAVLRRAAWRGRLRRWHGEGGCPPARWMARLGIKADVLARSKADLPTFESLWKMVENQSPLLVRQRPLRPSRLPVEIGRARRAIRLLRQPAGVTGAGPLAPAGCGR